MTEEFPSLPEQGKNLLKSAYDILKGKIEDPSQPVLVNDDAYNARLEICMECDKLTSDTQMCKLCGCYMKIKAKVTHAHCPEHKW